MPPDAAGAAHYDVSASDSSLTVSANSTLHAMKMTAASLTGYVIAAWNGDGTLAARPQPQMHVEFPVEQLRSGNGMQDREMQKLIDARRFPKVAADLRDVTLLCPPSRYRGSGDITLAGRSRSYTGEFSIAQAGDDLTLDGDLSVDMRDFGLKPPSLLILRVDPTLGIRLRLVARKSA